VSAAVAEATVADFIAESVRAPRAGDGLTRWPGCNTGFHARACPGRRSLSPPEPTSASAC